MAKYFIMDSTNRAKMHMAGTGNPIYNHRYGCINLRRRHDGQSLVSVMPYVYISVSLLWLALTIWLSVTRYKFKHELETSEHTAVWQDVAKLRRLTREMKEHLAKESRFHQHYKKLHLAAQEGKPKGIFSFLKR